MTKHGLTAFPPYLLTIMELHGLSEELSEKYDLKAKSCVHFQLAYEIKLRLISGNLHDRSGPILYYYLPNNQKKKKLES